MTPQNQKTLKWFAAVAAAAATYIITEAILNAFGMSICSTDGCKAVSEATRYGDLPFLAIGSMSFATIAIAARRFRSLTSETAPKIIDAMLYMALSAEAILVAYQYLFLRTLCLFCLTVFALWMTLLLIRALPSWPKVKYHLNPAAIAITAAAISAVMFLLAPQKTETQPLPTEKGLVLFFNSDCPHCKETIKKLADNGIAFTKYPYKDYAATLSASGITKVPTLLVTEGNKKTFLTGQSLIQDYIAHKLTTAKETDPPEQQEPLFGTRRPTFLTQAEIRKSASTPKPDPQDICDGLTEKPCK